MKNNDKFMDIFGLPRPRERLSVKDLNEIMEEVEASE